MCYGLPPVDRVGIRELRNNVAAVVRRAAAGERIVVTVDGRPAAQLGPLDAPASPTLDDLVAAGLARGPGRRDRPGAPLAEDAPVDIRPDGVLDELRGR
jgi:prevent-host-death family protein